MKAFSLSLVEQKTGRKMTVDEALGIAGGSGPRPVLRNMSIALSLHSWLNTREDWLRLQAALVLLRSRVR